MDKLLRSGDTFSSFLQIITFSSGICSVISSLLPSVFCLVTRVVPGFLNLPLMYLIHLDIVQNSSILCILRICVAAGTFPASYRTLAILVRYSILRASAWLFDTFLPEYANRIPVVISVSLILDVMCVNWRCNWVIFDRFNDVCHIRSLTTPRVILNTSIPCISVTISPDMLFFFCVFYLMHA